MAVVLLVALIVIAVTSGVLVDRHESGVASQGRGVLIRSIAYWLFTVLVVFELAAGALWDLLHIEYVRVVLTQLGYPQYLLIILGVWRIPGALVLLAPRFRGSRNGPMPEHFLTTRFNFNFMTTAQRAHQSERTSLRVFIGRENRSLL